MKYKTVVTETYWNGTDIPLSRIVYTDEKDIKTAWDEIQDAIRAHTNPLGEMDYEHLVHYLSGIHMKYHEELKQIRAKD